MIAGPVRTWVAAAPIALPRAARKLRAVVRPVEQVSRAASQVEQAARVARRRTSDAVVVQGPSLSEARLRGHRVRPFWAASSKSCSCCTRYSPWATCFCRSWWGMATSRAAARSRRRLSRSRGRRESSISAYLGLTALINISGRRRRWRPRWRCWSMPTPLVWGTMVALAEFVPVRRHVLTMAAVLMVAALTTFRHGAATPLIVPKHVYLAINFSAGQHRHRRS